MRFVAGFFPNATRPCLAQGTAPAQHPAALVYFLHPYNPKLFIMENNEKPNVNHQTHGHQEGQQNNTGTSQPGNKSGVSNNNQPMSNMLNEPDAQQAGNAHNQADESDVQNGGRTS